MSHRFGYEGCLIGALLLSLMVLCLVSVQSVAGSIGTGKGFGNLRWGDTVDQALKTYPDLHFTRYRIVDEKEEPFQVYLRGPGSNRVDGVGFDSVEYWFRGGMFYGIQAVLASGIGPRTLVTQAERSYGMLADRIRRAYGKPKEFRVNYVTEYLAVIKEARWERPGMTILLRYNGAAKENVDRLTLDIRKQGEAP